MTKTPNDSRCATQAAERCDLNRQRVADMTAEASLVAFARFATGVVHEVNNPLGIALSSAQLALRHLPSSAPPQHVRCLERVVESVRAASNAIREMLQASSGFGLGSRTQVFDVRDVLRFATTAMQGEADERGCVVVWNVSTEKSQIAGNPLAIEIAIASLVYRAIESGATKVELSSHVRGEWLEVVIAGDVFDLDADADGDSEVGVIEQIVREHEGELDLQMTDDGSKSILRFRINLGEERGA
jgi:signal transduction histidine kinase